MIKERLEASYDEKEGKQREPKKIEAEAEKGRVAGRGRKERLKRKKRKERQKKGKKIKARKGR